MRIEERIPSMSLETLGLDVVKLGVPSVYSVWVGVDSDTLWAGELNSPDPDTSSLKQSQQHATVSPRIYLTKLFVNYGPKRY